MSQQDFGKAIPSCNKIPSHVLPGANQVSDRLVVAGRNMNRRKFPGAIESRKLYRVAPAASTRIRLA
jgi:hypothetical protein